jgi:hypothetical protein
MNLDLAIKYWSSAIRKIKVSNSSYLLMQTDMVVLKKWIQKPISAIYYDGEKSVIT